MRKHNLPLTYKPKIPAVLEGRCTQTIRAGRKIRVRDLVSFHGWEGRPYSKWSFRMPYKEIHTVWNVKLFAGGIGFPEIQGIDYSPYMFRNWDLLDWLAKLDFIDPPTGEELGNVLLSMHKIPLGGLPAQIIRWRYE
jgi:hypothetical protein